MNTFKWLKRPILILTIFIIVTCKKDEERPREYPRLSTLEVTNISDKGATFRADVFSAGNEEVIDHGFVWGITDNLSLDYSDRISLNNFKGLGQFEAEIKTTLAIKKEYFVRGFVKTANHIVYGKVVSFISLGSGAPIITGFEPKTAGWGDTITIKGKNFSGLRTSNKVYFGNTLASTYPPSSISNDSIISVIIPPQVETIKNLIAVEIVGNRSTFTADTFKLIPPIVTDFKPKQGFWGDTITIYGKYLNYISHNAINSLKLSNVKCVKFVYLNRDSISFIIPNELDVLSCPIAIQINNLLTTSSNLFQLIPPIISDFKPKMATWNDRVAIYGKFNLNTTLNKVYFNNVLATITQANKDSIIVKVPIVLSNGISNISYRVNNLSVNAPISFQLAPPIITSFSPTKSISGSCITINGKNFMSEITNVYFNDVLGKINSCSGTVINVTVPTSASGPFKIKVKVGDQTTISENDFTIANPTILSISPITATFNDTIYINGENLTSGSSYYLNTTQGIGLATPYLTPSLIKVIVPPTIAKTTKLNLVTIVHGYYSWDISVNYSTSQEDFNLLSPLISSLSQNSGTRGQEVILQGNNFNPTKENNIVYFGNVKATVLSASKTEIKVNTNKLTSGEHKVLLTMNGFQIEANQPYSCSDPWKYIAPLTFTSDYNYQFTIDNQGYLLTVLNTIYYLRKYDPVSNTWVSLTAPSFNSNTSFPRISFTVGGKIYLLSGSNRIDAYDPATNIWAQLKDFPSTIPTIPFTFSIANKAYIGCAEESLKFWEYDPASDIWTQKAPLPSGLAVANLGNYYEYKQKSTFSLNNKGFVINNQNSVWEYSPSDDSWIQKNNFPGGKRFWATSLVIGNKGYIASGLLKYYDYSLPTEYDDLWEYNSETDVWLQKTSIPGNKRWKAFAFEINNKIYFGGGRYYNTSNYYNQINDQSFYEYDPTLEP